MRDNFHKYGVLIPATGLITVYEVEINKELRSLQEAVGGHIEPIPCSNGDLLLCNEHAKFKNLPINNRATQYAFIDMASISRNREGVVKVSFPDCIAGVALLLPPPEEPDFSFFTKEEAQRICDDFN